MTAIGPGQRGKEMRAGKKKGCENQPYNYNERIKGQLHAS